VYLFKPLDLEQASQYSIADIYECMTMVLDVYRGAFYREKDEQDEENPELRAVGEKYRNDRYAVATVIFTKIS